MVDEKMPFVAHLGELRKRLMFSVAAIFAGFVICFAFSEDIFGVLTIPLRASIAFKTLFPFVYLVPRETAHELIFLGPAEAFWAHMKIAMISGVVIATPILFFECWRFVSPGLHEKERRLAAPFMGVTTGLFFTGTIFCFVIVLPFAMKFLLTYKTEHLTPMLSVGKYIDFSLKFILAFGVVFELPVVIVFLTRMGVVTPEILAKNRKYAVLLAFVAAAVLTPTPDAFNQSLMAVPIIVLYEGGILASRLVARRRHADDQGKEPQSDGI